MPNSVRLALVGFASVGLAVTILWHVAVLQEWPALDPLWPWLMAGVFLVWLPTVLELSRFRSSFRGIAGWALVLDGVSPWFIWLPIGTGAYAVANFVAATGQLGGRITSSDPSWPRVASGAFIAFYGTAFATLYAAYRRAALVLAWRCRNGHYLDDPAVTCPQCGAGVAAAPRPVPGA